ncbi:uncharacterized protein HaLaN_20783, partial [Haematococcus lacustris]
GKPFEESALRRWLAQLLLALHYLQHKGVLHGYVQLGDFGLASVCDSGRASHDQSLVGTPHYMSPELLAAKGYHHPTDVWSLGCVMYELTALKPAFNAFNLQGLIKKIKACGPAPLPAGFSAEWQAIIKSMLVKDPERRPSVQELMSVPDLRLALEEAHSLARGIQVLHLLLIPPLHLVQVNSGQWQRRMVLAMELWQRAW